MEKAIEFYSQKNLSDTKECDVFLIISNQIGNVYGYLPYIDKHMSLSEDEYSDYMNGAFDKKFTKLTEKEYKLITKSYV